MLCGEELVKFLGKPEAHLEAVGWYLVEVGEDPELGPHLWDGVLELLDPPLLLRFLLGPHSPLALDQQPHSLNRTPPHLRSDKRSFGSYLCLPLRLLLLELQAEAELLQR